MTELKRKKALDHEKITIILDPKLGETAKITPTHKQLAEAGLVQMLIFEIMTNVDGTNITHNRTLEANGSATFPKESIQKALKQIGAGKETEDALDTWNRTPRANSGAEQ